MATRRAVSVPHFGQRYMISSTRSAPGTGRADTTAISILQPGQITMGNERVLISGLPLRREAIVLTRKICSAAAANQAAACSCLCGADLFQLPAFVLVAPLDCHCERANLATVRSHQRGASCSTLRTAVLRPRSWSPGHAARLRSSLR
jgi:hypothetical protein